MGRKSRVIVRISGLSALPSSARKASVLAAAVRSALAREKLKAAGEVCVAFLPRARMRAMNREYLGHDYDTDVISFIHEPVPGIPAAERPFGDVFVSGWMARRQARELGHSVLREAVTLAVHGALHLAGHDDRLPEDKARMFRVQDALVAESLG